VQFLLLLWVTDKISGKFSPFLLLPSFRVVICEYCSRNFVYDCYWYWKVVRPAFCRVNMYLVNGYTISRYVLLPHKWPCLTTGGKTICSYTECDESNVVRIVSESEGLKDLRKNSS